MSNLWGPPQGKPKGGFIEIIIFDFELISYIKLIKLPFCKKYQSYELHHFKELVINKTQHRSQTLKSYEENNTM